MVAGNIHSEPGDVDQLSSSLSGGRDTFSIPGLDITRAPETLYQMLVEHIPAMVYLSSPDDPGDVRYVSPQVREWLGYEPEEWLAMSHFWKELLHPDDRERVLEVDCNSARTGDVFEMQYRLFHRDGHIVWLSDQGVLIHDGDGQPLCWLGFTFDISEQKRIQDALRETEERYRTLVEQIPAVTFTVNADHIHHPVYLSPQVEELFGYSREEWLADTDFWLKIIHPDDLEDALEWAHATDNPGGTISHEYRMIARDGRTVWVQNESSPVLDAEGRPVFWQGVLVDITDRKLAEQALREAEERYRTLVEQIPVTTFVEPRDGNGVASYVSPQIERLLGYPLEHWRENPDTWVRSVHPDDYDMWLAEVERTNRTGDPFDLEHRMIAADGRIVWVRSMCQLVSTGEDPQFWQGTVQDITEAVLAEKRLDESEQRYRSLFDHNPDPVYSFDLQGIIESANNALSGMTGYSVKEMLGKPFQQFITPEDVPFVEEQFAEAVRGMPQNYECSVLCKDGSTVEVHVTNLPIVVSGEIVGVYGVAKDISERKELERQLKHMAFHDPLTDLPNRVLFMDRLRQSLASIPRRTLSIAVLFVDLDNFKLINDNHGHDAGDQVLRQVAGEIQASVRAGDTVSRLGGDEFTILLQDVESLSNAVDIAERILQRLDQPMWIEGHAVQLSASIGIVLSSSPEDDPEALIRRGDKAMYRAKALGKSRYEVYAAAENIVADL